MRIFMYMITFLFFMDNLYFLHQKREDEDLASSKVTLPDLSTGVIELFNMGKHQHNRNAKRQKISRECGRLLFRLLLSLTIITALAYMDINLQHTDKKILNPSNFLSPSGDTTSNVQPKYSNLLDLKNTSHLTELRMPSFLKRHRLSRNSHAAVMPTHLQKLFEDVTSLRVSGTNGLNVMRHEWARYGSFKTFPEDSPAMPGRLAAAGFFYIGPGDRVQCFSCKLIYINWKIEDVPFDVHRRLSPRCKFLEDDEDGNLSIHEGSIGSQGNHIQMHAQNRPAPNTTDGMCVNMNSNGACFETPEYVTEEQLHLHPAEDEFLATCKHPHYKEFAIRLSSYSKWPCGDIQEPTCLAEAGFFYAGFSDCVRCFCCGLGLRNWEFGDGAWSEHKRWSADCKYLTRRRRDNLNTTDDIEIQPPSSAANITESAVTGAEANVQDVSEITESKHANYFEAGINSQVLQMGFDRTIVEEAVQVCKGGTGKAFTCEELIDVIFRIENSQSTTSASATPRNVEEPAAASKQPTVSANFIDKVSHERNYDDSLSTDCLREENRRLKDQLLCKICLEKKSNMVLIPCGHMVSCETCARNPALRKCPMCRKLVKDRVKAFLS